MKGQKINWQKYIFEFLSIFIGVSLAFALGKWNEDRREQHSEYKTIMEIRNGLSQDAEDIRVNILGHKEGLLACDYFRAILDGQSVSMDSIGRKYFFLLRDYISIQNKTGYESLKSKGLELIEDDSLRFEIISLYDFNYEILEKLEEDYDEMQFNKNYYKDINLLLSPFMQFDKKGQLIGIETPKLSKEDKNKILSYLWRIENNRRYVLKYYGLIQAKIESLIRRIDRKMELEK